MALLSSSLAGEVAVRFLFSPFGSRIFARWACVVGGIAFPIYSSVKAIELKDQVEQDHWLFYWTAYGCFSALEKFFDKIFFWLPGYYHAKLLFLIYLQLPMTSGARHVVLEHVRPILLKHQGLLDRIVKGARSDINNFLLVHLQELKFLKTLTYKLLKHACRATEDVYHCLGSSSTSGTGDGSSSGGSSADDGVLDNQGRSSSTD